MNCFGASLSAAVTGALYFVVLRRFAFRPTTCRHLIPQINVTAMKRDLSYY